MQQVTDGNRPELTVSQRQSNVGNLSDTCCTVEASGLRIMHHARSDEASLLAGYRTRPDPIDWERQLHCGSCRTAYGSDSA